MIRVSGDDDLRKQGQCGNPILFEAFEELETKQVGRNFTLDGFFQWM